MRKQKNSEVHLDRIRGCLIGGAAGDALGYPVEFLREEEIHVRYTKDGIMGLVPSWSTGKWHG